jgi:hypothetical protein
MLRAWGIYSFVIVYHVFSELRRSVYFLFSWCLDLASERALETGPLIDLYWTGETLKQRRRLITGT